MQMGRWGGASEKVAEARRSLFMSSGCFSRALQLSLKKPVIPALCVLPCLALHCLISMIALDPLSEGTTVWFGAGCRVFRGAGAAPARALGCSCHWW